MDIRNYTFEILDYINILYEKNKSSFSDISLMNGITGLALANLSVGINERNTHYKQFSRKIIETVIDKINNDDYELKNMVSYCNGFAGICETLNLFSNRKIIEFNLNEDLAILDDFLFENAIILFENNNPDYLHGAMGILYYFSNRYDGNNSKFENYIDVLLNKYQSMVVSDEKGYRIFNNVLLDQQKNEFNFSLSHGLSGHAIIFLNIYKRYQSPIILNLVKEIERYMDLYERQPLSDKNRHDTYFPTYVIEESLDSDLGYDSRLAWCYGELNYAMMYFKFYEIFKEKKHLNKAKKILENTIHRNNPKEARVDSPFFCHGSSGLIALNLYFYNKTQNKTYYDIANYWKIYTLDAFPKEKLFKTIENNPLCILEGGTGLVIGLSSFMGQHLSTDINKNVWERILLLN